MVQLTKLSALSLFGNASVGQSAARAPSVVSLKSRLPARWSMPQNHRQRLAAARAEMPESPHEILSTPTGGAS